MARPLELTILESREEARTSPRQTDNSNGKRTSTDAVLAEDRHCQQPTRFGQVVA